MSGDSRHVYGSTSAPITIVEFGDFECPYCKDAAAVLRELVDSGEGAVNLEFRHFPLFQVHPYALTAALAAEAAAAQGLFWPMHDLLFAHQDRLTDDDLRQYATSLGIDPETAVGEPAQVFKDLVKQDYAAGIEAGIAGTPTLVIRGARFDHRIRLSALREEVARLREADGRAPWARR